MSPYRPVHSSHKPPFMERLSWIATVIAAIVSILAYVFPSPLDFQVLIAFGSANGDRDWSVVLRGVIFFIFLAAFALGGLVGAVRYFRKRQLYKALEELLSLIHI